MRYSPSSHHSLKHWSGRCLIGLAYLTLLLASAAGLALWRLHSVQLVSIHNNDMPSLFRNGDAVLVKEVPFEKIKPNNIVSYYNPTDHRQIETRQVVTSDLNKKMIITRNSFSSRTETIDHSLLIGIAYQKFLRLGYVLDFTHSYIGLLATIYIPAIFIAIAEIQHLKISYTYSSYRLKSYAYT